MRTKRWVRSAALMTTAMCLVCMWRAMSWWPEASSDSTSAHQHGHVIPLLEPAAPVNLSSNMKQLWVSISNQEMAHYREKVADWLLYGSDRSNDSYHSRIHHIRSLPVRQGILIVAGGKYLTSLVVLLKVLREHLKCTLPVQVAYRSHAELSQQTLDMLTSRWGPITGLDLSSIPQPGHHKQVQDMGGWVAKVYALYMSAFQQVLLLDADSLPLIDPTHMFKDSHFTSHGSLFWPDIWSDWVPAHAYAMLGLNATSTKAALSAGQQPSTSTFTSTFTSTSTSTSSLTLMRDTESGQLFIDLLRHADVLEFLWYINTFAPQVYNHLHGDKDTFAMAFAMAGKAHDFQQVHIPPGGSFRWGQGVLEVKDAKEGDPNRYVDGWQLVGCVQYHPTSAQPLFLHRTMAKWLPNENAVPIHLITGPLPSSWASYYLAHNSIGPTKGRWWEHVMPSHAVNIIAQSAAPAVPGGFDTPLPAAALASIRPGPHVKRTPLDPGEAELCQVQQCIAYVHARAVALPVDVNHNLERPCSGFGQAKHRDGETDITTSLTRPEPSEKAVLGQPVTDAAGEPVPYPLLAMLIMPNASTRPWTRSLPELSSATTLGAEWQAYKAHEWLRKNKHIIPELL